MYKNSITAVLIVLTLFISACDKKSDSSSGDTSEKGTDDNKTVVEVTKQPTLIVMLQYSAPLFQVTESELQAGFFGTDPGSVNDYFHEVSGGQFTLQPVKDAGNVRGGVVKVILADAHPNSGSDYNKTQPGIEASIKKISNNGFDFSVYDTDGDKKISAKELTLVFVVAGAESATLDPTASNNPDGVGALTTYLDNSFVPTVNGVTLMNQGVGKYFVMGERHYNGSTGTQATIGIIVHELGHAVFGLPDLYDTNTSKNGIGSYGLMGMGEWNLADSSQYPGETPAHLSAWSKIKAGLITPETYKPTDSKEIILYATGTDKYNVVKIEVTKNEYFLIENRGSTGFDRGLGADSTNTPSKGGVAIWHIDESIIAKNPTKPNNNTTHKGIDLEEADGLESIDNQDVDDDLPSTLLYGITVTKFTPTTTPSSKLYDGTDSKVYITNISTVGSKMTLHIGK